MAINLMTRRYFANRLLLLLTALSLFASSVTICAQQASTSERDQKAIDEAVNGWWTASMKTHDQRIAGWREAKFGCFIHWGVYSTFGGEWNGKPFRGYAEHKRVKVRT